MIFHFTYACGGDYAVLDTIPKRVRKLPRQASVLISLVTVFGGLQQPCAASIADIAQSECDIARAIEGVSVVNASPDVNDCNTGIKRRNECRIIGWHLHNCSGANLRSGTYHQLRGIGNRSWGGRSEFFITRLPLHLDSSRHLVCGSLPRILEVNHSINGPISYDQISLVDRQVSSQLSFGGIFCDADLDFSGPSLPSRLFGLISGLAKTIGADDVSIPGGGEGKYRSNEDEGIYQDTGTPKLIVPFPISPFYGFVLIGLIPIFAFVAYRTYSALALFGVCLCMILGIPAIVLGCPFGP